MSGSGATIGLQRTTTIMPHLIIPMDLIVASITWCAAVRGIGAGGVRVASELPLVFGTTSRVTHSAFVWFGDLIGKSSIYNPRPQLHLSFNCSITYLNRKERNL